jgi:hypothetical protein
MAQLRGLTAATAAAGGAAWVATCITVATLPRGCIDEECLTRPIREWSTAADVLGLAALILLAINGVCFLALVRTQGGLGKAGKAAAGIGGVALCLFGAGAVASWVSPSWTDDNMPAFVVPGGLLMILAIGLTAWTILRSHLLPTWLVVALMASAALMVGANEQTSRILLAVPFGVCWLTAGLVLLTQRVSTGAARSSSEAGP